MFNLKRILFNLIKRMYKKDYVFFVAYSNNQGNFDASYYIDIGKGITKQSLNSVVSSTVNEITLFQSTLYN